MPLSELDPQPCSLDNLCHEEHRIFLDSWLRKKGERSMATREDVMPREMKPFLRRTHLYKVVDDGRDFEMRIVGMDVFGTDQVSSGQCLSAYPDPHIRARFTTALRQVFNCRKPVLTTPDVGPGQHIGDMTEILWLPLGPNETVEHVVAVSVRRRVA